MLKFKFLELNDKDLVENFLINFPYYSDFNFTSLFSWSLHSQTKFCLGEDCLYIILPDYTNQKPIISFMGHNPVSNLISVLEFLEKEKSDMELRLIPHHVAKKITIEEQRKIGIKIKKIKDRDNFDYIIDVEKIFKSSGREYKSYRQKISRFKHYHQDVTTAKFNPNNDTDINKVMALSKLWGKYKKNKGAIFEDELYALSRFLTNAKTSNKIRYQTLVHNNRFVGFISYEIIDSKHTIGHFLKYDPSYDGSYQMLIKLMCEDLYELGGKYINIEQDLGIPTLRHAKMHLRPSKFLEKYTITKI